MTTFSTRKTKIVATLGPATEKKEMIEQLIRLGVNVFRLNFSHGNHEYHDRLIDRVRETATHLKAPVAILQDISGPKIRVEAMEPLFLQSGDHLHIWKRTPPTGCTNCVTVNYPQVLETVRPREQIYLADGTIRTEVESIDPDRITTRVLVGGTLTSKKGVHLPISTLKISAITQKDREDIAFGVSRQVDLIAMSFVRSADDIREVKRLIAEHDGRIPVFAKIEKAEALEALDAIISEADGIMIARGDLGVELGVHRVPVIQKRIAAKASHKGIPVIIATQMLISMITSPYPTRAEVSDIANAVLDGADAVMLSDETTVGEFPREAIQVLTDTVTETETIYPWFREFREQRGTRRAMAAAAVTLVQKTGVKSIVSFTESGLSALMVARQRPKTRIIAVTSNPHTYRRLAVVWGVEPFWMHRSYLNSDEAIYHFYQEATASGFIEHGHSFVVTIGRHSNKSGSTNVVQLIDRQSIQELKSLSMLPSCHGCLATKTTTGTQQRDLVNQTSKEREDRK